jgi:hypothetical protein
LGLPLAFARHARTRRLHAQFLFLRIIVQGMQGSLRVLQRGGGSKQERKG